MDNHSILTSAVLSAAALLPVVPPDLSGMLAVLKARQDQEPSRAAETEMTDEIAALFERYGPEIASQILMGQQPDTREMEDKLLLILIVSLAGVATAAALRRAEAVGVPASLDDINQAARTWSRSYGYELVRGINETTRQAIADVMAQYHSTPGMTTADVSKLLETTFGRERANRIAVTEITRANTQAVNIAAQQMAGAGITTSRQWITWRDDRVCPLCAPLHNTYEDVWTIEQPAGPPAHVTCRCWLALVRM